MKTRLSALALALLLGGGMASAQKILVTGRVTNASKAVLPKIQVVVKETGRSMATTEQGLYVIELESGQTLQFILDGKILKTIVATQPQLDVELSVPATGDRDKTRTDSTAVHHQGEGKDDVILSTSSRGATSITGKAKPLWVLNGVVLGSDYGSLEAFSGADPKQVAAGIVPGLSIDNIASVRILTTSSETSSYGPRGIAGVVEITTKSGAAGVSSLSYRGEFIYRPIPSYDNLNVMNSQQHVALIQDLLDGGMYPIHTLETNKDQGLVGRMYQLFNELDASGKPRLTNDEASRLAYFRAAERANTNWFKELYRNTIVHNHTLSFNGGTDKTNLFASLTARVDPGWTIGSRSNTYSGNMSADYKLLPTLKIGLNLIGEYTTSEDPSTSAVKYANTTSRALHPTENYTKDYVSYNIFDELRESRRTKTLGYLGIQGTATWDILKQLRATFVTDIKYTNTVTFLDNTEHSVLARSMRAMQTTNVRNSNKNLRTDPNDPYALPYSVLPEGGIRESRVVQNYINSFKLDLDYHQTFGKHNVVAAAGVELNQGSVESNWNINYGVLYDLGFHSYYLPDAIQYLYEQGKDYYTIRNRINNNLGILTRASYSFANRYSIDALLRFDASNRFGPSRYVRWLPTWNVELTWGVDRESFFRHLRPLSSLRLKTYVGMVADNPSVTNSLEEIYPAIPWRPNSKEIGLAYKDLANHDLTYEKTLTYGARLGFGLFKGRISAEVDAYRRRSYDLVGPIYTQSLGGVAQKNGNVAELQSSGLQFTLSTVNLKVKNFSWTTGFSYLHKTNKITSLLSNPTVRTMISGSGFSYEGYPLSSVFSIPFLGLTNEGMPRFYNERGQETLGDFNFSSSNINFLKYSGTLDPTDVGTLTNTFRYKNFSLSANINYEFGAVTRLRSISNTDDYSAFPRELTQRWKKPGDEKHTDIPRLPTSYAFDQYGADNLINAYYAYGASTARIVSTDFIRLKEISMEYTVSKTLLRRTPLKNLAVKLQAQNLMLLYSDARLRGDDPEYMYSSSVTAPKKLILTLRVGL
nr:SusC/RagA family protein [uncultured Porphyromonas sp.]